MYKIEVETDRMLLRELRIEDADFLFELDSDPRVHEFLGKNPLKTKDQVYPIIEGVMAQYERNNIGRWAMILKESGEFMGWTGLKLEPMLTNGYVDYYDLGFRMIPRYWGKGYATESARKAVEHGFNELGIEIMYGAAHYKNIGSNKALQKSGLRFVESFVYDDQDHNWYELKKEDYKNG